MQLSFSTLAVVLTTLAASAPEVAAAPSANEGRSINLCSKPNFGAVGKPWEKGSTPAAFCGTKPATVSTIPSWDGGDSVKCGGWYSSGLKICNGGNPKASLPYKCNPPHKFPSNWGQSGTWVTKCTPATCNWSQWWTCIYPSSWVPHCTTAWVPATSSSSSSSAGPSSSTAAAASPSSTAVPASSSTVAASSSAAAASPSADVPTTSSASAPAPSVSAVDPLQYPVCNQKYQVTYTNYTLVAPNGYWYGKTVGAATQDDSYMTFTLASSPDECLKACDGIEGCVFVNSYIDRNDDEAYLDKHTPGVYTCAMFSKCVGTEKNDNWGGQDDPNDILESNGYCKSGACGV